MRSNDGLRLSSVALWCRMVGVDYNQLKLELSEANSMKVISVKEAEAISPLESQACAMCRHTMIPSRDGKNLTVEFSCNELFTTFFMKPEDVVEAWKRHHCAAKVLVAFVFQTDQNEFFLNVAKLYLNNLASSEATCILRGWSLM